MSVSPLVLGLRADSSGQWLESGANSAKTWKPKLKRPIKKVEFISALIRDIREEDIQNEYAEAFVQVHAACTHLAQLYDAEGITEESEGTLVLYKGLLNQFEEDYEL